ncbi:MAG TPA: riboflavin kinase, partial [bacterium]|nr:riboflavin kinase [bacterium]
MDVVYGLVSLDPDRAPAVLALGTFDGVHLGHQALLRETVRRAREIGGRAGTITFDPHPLAVIAPPEEKLVPAAGIYAALARTERGTHQAAVSIGTRPTFGPGAVVVEA